MAGELDTVGKRIRWLRTEASGREMTFREIGEICGVSAQSAEQWEKIEKRTPRQNRMARLASYFGIETSWIMYGGAKPETTEQAPLKPIAKELSKAIPLLNMQKTRFNTVKMAMAEARSTGNFRTTNEQVSEDAAFYLITDKSMDPEYRIGEEILIDPKADLLPGDDVLIDCEEWSFPVFRRYKLGPANTAVFEAMNSNYDAVTCPRSDIGPRIKVMGVMMEHRKKRRA